MHICLKPKEITDAMETVERESVFVGLKICGPISFHRVATSELDLNSLTFPDFFGALFPDFP